MAREILIVDDDIDLCKFLEFHLSKHDFNCTISPDTAGAIEALDQKKFGAILLDINLGKSTSAEVLVKIKSNKNCINYKVPVIMLSAFYRKETMTLLQDKVDAVISKPINLTHLVAILNNFTDEKDNDSKKCLIDIHLEKIFILFRIISPEERAAFENEFINFLQSYEAQIYKALTASDQKNNVYNYVSINDTNTNQNKISIDDELDNINTDKTGSYNLQNINDQAANDIDKQNRFGQTALMLAARASDVDEVKKLLEKGASTKARDNDGKTPLHFAALSGNKEIVELILKAGGKNNLRDRQGLDPMSYAILYDHNNIIKSLILSGINLAFKNRDGETYLMMAILKKNAIAFEFLIKAGAKLNQLDAKGNDIYWYIRKNNDTEFVKKLELFLEGETKSYKF